MRQHFYSLDQVAELLGLHVRTVRGYVRDGRLKATRVGRQYRVTQEDLEVFTGAPTPSPARRTRHAEVSGIVQIDAISADEASRVANTVIAATQGRPGRGNDGHFRVEASYDEERASLKIIILGGLADTAEVLKIIDAVVEQS